YDNTLIRNNSALMPFALQPDGSWTNVRVVGNVAPSAPWLCNTNAVYSHNVWAGAPCGPTDVNAPRGFADPAHFDLHLAPGPAGTGAISGPSAAATTGLVAAYSFDEASGTTAKDSSGNGNAGTISNATWTTGKNGGALSFNGTTSLVTVADSPSLDLTNGMTLE